ncbi:transglutaminase domain-containing protein [Kineosporia sp. J2-2]|uniref:Transglutaminase domain-containing protein n=1 Tax=Kineosporia corallincola TaxID=2835133 RepID=A0ABS5TPK3_9ACTN|nr:transglutaminase domain-containing protein [Kineosporia corallincola]MBT0771519.1 transglutaminase domain-containing protein [Kineosporia corallincola]
MSAPVLDAPTRPAPSRPRPAQPPAAQPARHTAVATRTALGLLAVLAAACAWWRVYPPASLPVPALAGVLLGAGAVLLADRITQGPVRPAARLVLWIAAAFLAGLVTAFTVAVPRAVTPSDAVAGVGRAMTGGLARILTTTLPAPPAADLLPQFAVLCALAAAVTVVIARGRGGLLLAAPGLCLLLTALVCGVGGAGSPLVVGLPFAVAAALLVLPRPRIVPALVAGLVVAVGCAGGLVLADATREPLDPRHLTAPPLRAEQPTAPMDEVAGWLRHTNDTAFTATVDSAWRSDPQPWRIAALDTYDGIRWTSSTPAVPIGYDLPATDADSATDSGAGQARVSVTPVDLDGVYVPVSGRLRHLARPGMTYDLTGETLVDPDGVHGTYDQTVSLPERSGLARDQAGQAQAGDPSLALDGCTDDRILNLAETAVAGAGTGALAQAEALQTWFHKTTTLRLDPDAEPGDSCARVMELVDTAGGAGNGTPDQFATAYVLMARSLGLPARVAVGFAAGQADDTGKVTVSLGDATAWPEVWFDGAGWVSFSAVPDRTGSGQTRQEERQETTTTPDTSHDTPDDAAQSQPTRSGPTPAQERGDTGRLILIGLGATVLVLILLLPLAGLLLTLARRRRRRAQGPLGAWAELLDRLADLGHPSAGRTSAEVRGVLSGLDPGTDADARALARLVDAEVYAADRASGDSAQAWPLLRRIERALSPHTSRRRRVLIRVDPRPRRWA